MKSSQASADKTREALTMPGPDSVGNCELPAASTLVVEYTEPAAWNIRCDVTPGKAQRSVRRYHSIGDPIRLVAIGIDGVRRTKHTLAKEYRAVVVVVAVGNGKSQYFV